MLQPFLGGMIIGLAAGVLWFCNGRILGVSGILGGILSFTKGDTLWRILFFLGIFSGALVCYHLYPTAFEIAGLSPARLVIAGILVGFGTRMGNGCTSGHGVCGISRFSLRSISATLVFMAFGALTIGIVRHVLGGV